ncbi:hypothetical protein GQ44DRAFT_230807 [Phaeosphaeriaceae sp. PMI808]|nr:hypothetical protein GQ44DRAFT_230807 [Phaeosphaeriaceae sp. PMI808]
MFPGHPLFSLSKYSWEVRAEWATGNAGKDLDLRQISTYILTPNSSDPLFEMRRKTITPRLQQHGFNDTQFVFGIYVPDDPVYACAFGHGLVVEKALQRRPFRPFIILEDDALPEDVYEPVISIPPDADALYLSFSYFGVDLVSPRGNERLGGVYYSPTTFPNTVRIYNMLSAHAVLILTERFAYSWMRCSVEASAKSLPADVLTALTQRDYNVYAQPSPIFYQAGALGGYEDATRVKLQGIKIDDKDALPASSKALKSVAVRMGKFGAQVRNDA